MVSATSNHWWYFFFSRLFGHSFLNQQEKHNVKVPSYFIVRNQKSRNILMTSLHTKPPELSVSAVYAFSCNISIRILLKTLLFLSLTICQESIIFRGLKQKLHLTCCLINTFHSHPLNNNNYSNLSHEGKKKAFIFCSLLCIMEHRDEK